MQVDEFIRLVKTALKVKGERTGPLPTHYWEYVLKPDNIYEIIIHASPNFDFILVSEPGHCVLRVDGGVVKHYDFSSELAAKLSDGLTLDLLADASH